MGNLQLEPGELAASGPSFRYRLHSEWRRTAGNSLNPEIASRRLKWGLLFDCAGFRLDCGGVDGVGLYILVRNVVANPILGATLSTHSAIHVTKDTDIIVVSPLALLTFIISIFPSLSRER